MITGGIVRTNCLHPAAQAARPALFLLIRLAVFLELADLAFAAPLMLLKLTPFL